MHQFRLIEKTQYKTSGIIDLDHMNFRLFFARYCRLFCIIIKRITQIVLRKNWH